MAHTEHAKKSHRQSLKRREANRSAKSGLKTVLKSVRGSIGGDAAASAAALSAATARLDKAAKSGVIHRNRASRLKSRLAKAIARGAAKPS